MPAASTNPGPLFPRTHAVVETCAIAATVVGLALNPRNWRAPARDVFARQILFTSVEATTFVLLIAFSVAVAIVVQVQLWVNTFGASGLLGPILVFIVVRELGPLLIGLVVIGRSGNAMAAELGNMTIAGEIRSLDAQGVDVLSYIVLPRVVGWVVSVFCLTVIFIASTLAFGYLLALGLGAKVVTPGAFLDSIVAALRPSGAVSLLAKTLIPSILAPIIACRNGLAVEQAPVEVPRATSQTMRSSIVMLFVVSGFISFLTYLI